MGGLLGVGGGGQRVCWPPSQSIGGAGLAEKMFYICYYAMLRHEMKQLLPRVFLPFSCFANTEIKAKMT